MRGQFAKEQPKGMYLKMGSEVLDSKWIFHYHTEKLKGWFGFPPSILLLMLQLFSLVKQKELSEIVFEKYFKLGIYSTQILYIMEGILEVILHSLLLGKQETFLEMGEGTSVARYL